MNFKAAMDALEAAAREIERERCAKIAEEFPDHMLVFVERPGGPPGRYYRPSTKTDIAEAIRSTAIMDDDKRIKRGER